MLTTDDRYPVAAHGAPSGTTTQWRPAPAAAALAATTAADAPHSLVERTAAYAGIAWQLLTAAHLLTRAQRHASRPQHHATTQPATPRPDPEEHPVPTTPRTSPGSQGATGSSSTASTRRVVPGWTGPALVTAAAVTVLAEAVVAAAWDQRRYSYAQDYVSFLGSPFAGTFQGVVISSPLWWLMSAAWILTGVLVATAALALSRSLAGWRARATAALGVASGTALVLFALFPLGPARTGDPTLAAYLLGAFVSIIAGNALALVVGLSARRLGLPRWLATTSVVLGVVGLVTIPATYGWAPTGVAERLSVYPYLLWALLTGTTLLRTTRSARA